MIESSAGGSDVVPAAEKKSLPPPWECVGTARGSLSNATLTLYPTDDPHSGYLVQDQLYRMRLLVSNPLFHPTKNSWRLLSFWGEKKGAFVTLHDAQITGFVVEGMEASIAPGSLEAAAFHMTNITFSPHPLSAGAHIPQLVSLFVVAPRGTELSCVGFQPGSLGGGTGVAGWSGAERIACSASDQIPVDGACEWSGRPPPRGLWSLCLTFPRAPDWDSVISRGLEGGLWFVVPTINPLYIPFDNVWAVALLGEQKGAPTRSDAGLVGARELLDATGLLGYSLMKQAEV